MVSNLSSAVTIYILVCLFLEYDILTGWSGVRKVENRKNKNL